MLHQSKTVECCSADAFGHTCSEDIAFGGSITRGPGIACSPVVNLQDGNWWCYIRWLFDCSVTYLPLHLI
jgi:hypothetical protein